MKRLTFFDKLFIGAMMFLDMSYSAAQKLPGDSALLLPQLNQEITTFWPDLKPKAFIASVIDQESNWKIKAALKTSREFGCGLAQFTVAYDKDGKPRFDALEETKRLDRSLRAWDWKDCYNSQYQMRAAVLKLRQNERNCSAVVDGLWNIKACNGAAYNGGFGSVTKRIRYCRMEKGCNPSEWFGHLDQQCPQANVKVVGYGESFCVINSKYPSRVFARLPKFQGIWPDDPVFVTPK